MAFGFENKLALAALSALIPLIIIYLIKPRPVKQPIPSLMFFIRRSRLSKRDSFFRHFQRDWLFLLQLLAISLLAFSASQPYRSQHKDIVSGNTVFVLDASASSKTIEGETTRFEKAKEKIRETAGERSSLILAKSVPLIAAQDVDKSELSRTLARTKATDEESAIGEAILLAGETLNGKKGRVIVLSDLITTKGINTETAKNVLISKGIPVDLISTAEQPRKNTGIIKLVPAEDSITLYVKNYNPQEETITITANGQEQQATLKPESIETLLLKPQEALTEIEITTPDDFPTDNKAYVSKPTLEGVRVQLITNNKSRFIEAAIKSLEGVTLDIAEPPIIPKGEYDLYIIHNINKQDVIAGTFEDILTKARAGASVIIHAQRDSDTIDYRGLLPVEITNLSTDGDAITTDQINKFTRDIDFGNIGAHFGIDPKDAVSIASANGDTIIAIKQEGNGLTVYYGILEKDSEFRISPSYPVFWTNLLKFLTNTPELDDINLKTGASIQADDGTFIPLEQTGVIETGRQKIAVNLLNEEESNINPTQTQGKEIKTYTLEPVKEDVKLHLSLYFLSIATLIVLLELVYTKTRGEA